MNNIDKDLLGWIVLERYTDEYIKSCAKLFINNEWKRGWFRKWYLTKEDAQNAIDGSESVYPENKNTFEYKIVPVFGELATIKLDGNSLTAVY